MIRFSPEYSIKNAFDGNENTSYISNGKNSTTTITVNFLKSKAIEKIRFLSGGSGINKLIGSLEAANNQVDLDNKKGSYRKVFGNIQFAGGHGRSLIPKTRLTVEYGVSNYINKHRTIK